MDELREPALAPELRAELLNLIAAALPFMQTAGQLRALENVGRALASFSHEGGGDRGSGPDGPSGPASTQLSRQSEPSSAAGADESHGLDTPLPCDVIIAHLTYRKGVKLRTLVDAATRWRERAAEGLSQINPAELKPLFADLGQLLNGVKQDWSATGEWSDWDADVLSRFCTLHARISATPAPLDTSPSAPLTEGDDAYVTGGPNDPHSFGAR